MIVLAVITHAVAGSRHDRVRRKGEKAIIVGSVLAIWFVIYMLSGLFTTFVHNTLAMNLKGIAVNIFAYAVPVAAMEYTRFKLMLVAGRRNVIWFGVIAASVFALQQMTLTQFTDIVTAADLVKLIVGNFIPLIVTSFLLTYLAISSGLKSMLVFQLGVVATTILPPFIPKYDWYLLGVSSILLAVAVYISIDRNAQAGEIGRHRRHHRHVKRAYDIMLVTTMVGLVMFMIGVFTYKPLAILSNSMVPIFSRGSIVIIEKLDDPMDIERGDIVQYESSGHSVTHRVVAIDQASDGSGERVFTTKGDNSPSNDPPVAAKQVVGIIRAQIPYIGYPSVWLHEITR